MKTMRTYFDRLQRRLRGEQMSEDEGFSLAELIIVVAIIAILAAVAVPMYMGQQEKARINGTKTELRAAKTALSSLIADEGHPVNVGAQVPASALDGFGVNIGATDSAAENLQIMRDGEVAYTLTAKVAGAEGKECKATMTSQPVCTGEDGFS